MKRTHSTRVFLRAVAVLLSLFLLLPLAVACNSGGGGTQTGETDTDGQITTTEGTQMQTDIPKNLMLAGAAGFWR